MPTVSGAPKTSEGSRQPVEPELAPPYVRDVQWDGCEGFATSARYPKDMVDDRSPPGWNISDFPTRGVILHFADCQRVSWGKFERPIRMLFEMHGYSDQPASCNPGDGSPAIIASGVLSSVFVNDLEFSSYLRDQYDLPVRFAEIGVAVEGTTPSEHVLSWGEPGQPKSELRTPIDPLPPRKDDVWDTRMFWFNTTAVSALDVHMEWDGPAWDNTIREPYGARVAYGTLQPPMLGAGAPHPAYLDQGEWQTNVTWTGRVTKFTDHRCTQEVP